MADADVTLKVGLDSKDVQAQAQQLQSKIESIFNKTDGKKMSSSFVRLKQNMRDLYRQSKQIEAELAKMDAEKFVPVDTKDYAETKANIEKITTEIDKLTNKLKEAQAVYGAASPQASRIGAKIGFLNKSREDALFRQAELERQNKATIMTPVAQTQEYQSRIAKQQQLNDKMQIATIRAKEMQDNLRGVRSTMEGVHNGATKVVHAVQRVVGLFKKLSDRIRGVNVNMDDTRRSAKQLLKFGLKYFLGLRSIFILYKRIRSAGVEAYKGLASQFPELQAELNSLKNSFFQLKNSIATMAQPILSYLVPAIKTLMSWLTAAMNAIANFFAILTGAKYIYKASNANKDWAKSAGGAGKAAKEANKDIAEYDNLMIIQQDNNNGGGGGGGAADNYAGAFEKVKAKSDLAEEIKDAINRGDWEGVGVALGKRLNSVTKKIDDWIIKMRPKAKKWASNIARILNGLVDTWDSALTGKTLADGLMAIYDTIATFFETFKWRNLGKKVGTMITSFFTTWEPDTVARKIAGKFNAIIEFLAGLIDKEKGINFKLVGQKLGETLKRTIQRIEWKQLGADLSGLATGILEGLSSFIKTSQVGKTVGNAINEFLSGINFGELTKDLSDLAINILEALADCIETTDWEAVGQAIADFLKNINWTKFITTLIKVAFNLAKGLGQALLKIATDPEALLSIAEGLLAIFGAKWIWKKITGLFASNLATSIAEGATTAGASTAAGGGIVAAVKGGLGASATAGIGTLGLTGASAVTYAVGSALAGGMATKVGGQIGAGIGGAIATALGDYDIAEEYVKEAENPFAYWVENAGDIAAGFGQVIKDAAVETHEMWQAFGDDVVGLVFEDPMTKYYKSAEYKENQKKLEEATKAYLDMLTKRYNAGRKITDEQKQMLIDLGRISDESKKKFETNSNHYADIARKQAGAVSTATQSAIDSSNHYAQIAQTNAQKHTSSYAQMSQSAQHHAEIAKANADIYANSRKQMEASSNHYAEIAKKNAQGVATSISGMVASGGNKLAKLGTDAINSSNIMAQAYKDGTTKAETAFSGMEGSYQGMTDGIKTAVSTIPDSFNTTFTSAYDKVTNAFSGVKTFFGDVAQGVKSPFSTMADYFKTTFSDSWNGVVSVFQSNSPQFQSIQDSVSGVFKSSINSMIGGLNSSFISPFRTLSSIFAKMRGFSIGGAQIFKSLPSFSVPSIPKLAQGAVIPPNREFMAVLGDQKQGTNIEAPLDTIVQALQIALENNTTNNQPITLNLNGRQIAQAVWDEENKTYKQTNMRYRYS